MDCYILEKSDKVAARVGIQSHLQWYLETFGFGSEDISLTHLQLWTIWTPKCSSGVSFELVHVSTAGTST